MEVSVVIVVCPLAAVMLAQGIFLFVGTVHRLVDQALFFKSAQGAVKRNAVYFSQFLLQIVLRKCLCP